MHGVLAGLALRRNGLVDVFVVVAEGVGGCSLDVGLCIFFGGSVLVEAVRNVENRQVLVEQREVDGLDLDEQLLAVLADKAVVVLVFDVDHEVKVLIDGGAGKCADGVDLDRALELLLLDVGQTVRRKEQVALLLHAEAVELEHLGRVDQRLCKLVKCLPFFSS